MSSSIARSFVALVFVIVVVMIAACGGGVAERPWIELRSSRFILRTDLDRDTAVEHLAALDATTRGLAETYAAVLGKPTNPQVLTNVVLFKHCGDGALDDKHAGMFVRSSDFTMARYLVACGDGRYARQVLMHELGHLFNRVAIGNMPVWLNEGLAEFLSSLEVVKNQVVIGRPTPLEGMTYGRPITLPTLQALTAAGHEVFHYGTHEHAFYFAAVSLVRILATRSEVWHTRFVRYLRLLAVTGDVRSAWREAYAGADMSEIEGELHMATTQTSVKSWTLPHSPASDFVAPAEKRMSPADVHVLFAHVQLMSGQAKDDVRLLARIDAAEAADPTFSDGDLWRALILSRTSKGKDPRIVGLYRSHASRHPDDERAWHGIVSHATGDADPQGPGDVDDKLVASLEAVEADALALGRSARSSSGFNTLAWYFALVRKPDVGLELARRSLELEPTCADCLDTMALLLAEKMRFDDAVAAQEQAVAMSVDLPSSSGILKRLLAYRALRDRCRGQSERAAGCPQKE